jgi:hypothetical protein
VGSLEPRDLRTFATPSPFGATDDDGSKFPYSLTERRIQRKHCDFQPRLPNKTVALSASLTDETRKPLTGRTVNFQLGTQSASAVTNLLGAAATSLKLSQKNGTYTVSATYNAAGNPLDGSHYLGSSQSASFRLQSKRTELSGGGGVRVRASGLA